MTFRASRVFAGLTFLGFAAAFGGACRELPVRTELPPTAVLRGTFLYAGPPPCTENGRIVGAGIILLFDERLLPPPEGQAGRSYRIRAIPGDALFADAARRLTFNSDGSRWCPPEGTTNIFASAEWDVSPVEAGRYQARAFYDRGGTFGPAFRYSNLPTRGDITGGAIDNITEALQGGRPRFTQIVVGTADAQGNLTMPELGLEVANITVAVALPQRVERPYFHVSAYQPALQPTSAGEVTPTTPAPDFIEGTPKEIVMPADFHLGTSVATQAQPYLYVLELTAGLPQPEAALAAQRPFLMRVDPTQSTQPVPVSEPKLPIYWFDLNRDGRLDVADDHVVGSTLAASLSPIVSLLKLDPADPIRRTAQAAPRVLSSAITLPTRNFLDILSFQQTEAARSPTFQDRVYGAIRPTAVCLPEGGSDANGDTYIVTPFKQTVSGAETIADVPGTKKDIATLLRRNPDKVRILYGCLPPGEFTINAINTPDLGGTISGGQAWTVPNESGVCMPGETATGDGARCTAGDITRPRLGSQDSVFRIGKPNDPAFCNANVYTADDGSDASQLFRNGCLSPAEQARFDQKALWNLP